MKNTSAANIARWGADTPQERWNKKVNLVILFIARLGWVTVELANAYLRQSKRDWASRMAKEGWIIFKNGIIGDRPASIIVLTRKSQSVAKQLDPRIGKRLDKEVTRQSRHDLIAAWVAVSEINTRTLSKKSRDSLEIWSDRVMRGFMKDETVRPDISIIREGNILINIEVERTRKTNKEEHFKFLTKLDKFQSMGIETIIIFEMKSQALKFIDGLKLAVHFGINRWQKRADSKTWFELASEQRAIFELYPSIMIWNHDEKKISDILQ